MQLWEDAHPTLNEKVLGRVDALDHGEIVEPQAKQLCRQNPTEAVLDLLKKSVAERRIEEE